MLKQLSAILFLIVCQGLVFVLAFFFWAFEAVMFEEDIHDSVISVVGMIVPQWYQLAVYYVFPILILVCLFIALQEYINFRIRNISSILFCVLTLDVIYLAFSLPGSVASKMEQQNISNHILSFRDMTSFILINFCLLMVGIIFWQRYRTRGFT